MKHQRMRRLMKKFKNKGSMKSVEGDEVNYLVSSPRLIRALGNRSGDRKTFDDLPVLSHFSMHCDLVSWRKVKPNDFFITKPSLSDGHGGIETQCKEYKLSRSDPQTRIHCKIPGGTKIGPVIEVRVVRIVGIYGPEAAVPSIRGKNRFVDEMEDPNISHNVPSINVIKEQADPKGASASEDVEHSFRKRQRAPKSSSSSRLETHPINYMEEPVCLTKRTILTLNRN